MNEEVKKTNKKSRKKLWSAIAIFTGILAVGALFLAWALNLDIKDPKAKHEGPYETYVAVTNDEFETMINEGETFFVYVGRDTCPYCAKFAPLLREVIQENNRLVYYYDTTAARSASRVKYDALWDRLGIDGVPGLLKFENGVRTVELNDRSSTAAILEFLNN